MLAGLRGKMSTEYAEKFNKHEKRKLEMQWKELERKWATQMKKLTQENYEIRKELTKLQEIKRDITFSKAKPADDVSGPGEISSSNGWMDGWVDGWTDGWMDGRMDGEWVHFNQNFKKRKCLSGDKSDRYIGFIQMTKVDSAITHWAQNI